MKNQYANNIVVGNCIEDAFFMKVNTSKPQDRGGFLLNGELCDKTGAVRFVWYDVDEEIAQSIGTGRVVGVVGTVKSSKYADRDVNISSCYRIKKSELDPDDFMASSPWSYKLMEESLRRIIGNVVDPDCRRLLDCAFPDKNQDSPDHRRLLCDAFLIAPAASSHHHAYRHGLLEHTLSVTELAMGICKSHHHIPNLDVVTTAALLHDIGKAQEFVFLPDYAGIGRTQRGNLLGHVVLGLMLVEKYIETLRDEGEECGGFDANTADHILHCIASHHAKLEYGSPVTPMTIEAMILSRADGLDAESFKVVKAMGEHMQGKDAVRIDNQYYYAKSLRRKMPEQVI